MTINVNWCRGLEDIEHLRTDWMSLEESVQDRTLYCRYDYVMPWYRCYGGDRSTDAGVPLVGVARRGDELVGIAPLISSFASFAGVPVRRAATAGYNLASGELLFRSDAPGTIGAIVDSLRNDLRFDLVMINGLLIDSSPYRQLLSHTAASGAYHGCLDYPWYAVADLREGYDAFCRLRGGKFPKADSSDCDESQCCWRCSDRSAHYDSHRFRQSGYYA